MAFVYKGRTYNSKKFPMLEYIFNQKTNNGTRGIGQNITFTLKDVSNGYKACGIPEPASISNTILDLTRKNRGIDSRLPKSISSLGYDLKKKTGPSPDGNYCGEFVYVGIGNVIHSWLVWDVSGERVVTVKNTIPTNVLKYISNDEGALFSAMDYCDILSYALFGTEGKVLRVQNPMKWQPNEIDGLYMSSDGETIYPVEAKRYRPENMDKRYISSKPLIKIYTIKEQITKVCGNSEMLDLFRFALSSILVPVSNVSYGPGFGVKKRLKDDADVVEQFMEKLNMIEKDLQSVDQDQKDTTAEAILGDSRNLCKYIEENSVSLMITSPPYPGDHEYTKHSKIELIFNEMAGDISSFRTIKKRMIVSSTTNIYKENNSKVQVESLESIKKVTDQIQERLDADHATSGYEKLYTRLVWEYFGCMKQVLEECYKALKKGGKIALLVSDSHAFKMVHIQTAEILKEIGEMVGFENSEIVLWQLKNTTSHKYQLRENILILEK